MNTGKERFKFDKYPTQAKEILTEFYKSEITMRGCEFIQDSFIDEYLTKVSDFLVNPKKTGLIIMGSIGNGKTTMAKAVCSMINTLYDSPVTSERKFIKTISAIKLSNMATEDKGDYQIAKKTPMLFIDDVGCEPSVVKVWGNELSPFVELIYHRYDNQLFTILTTNLNKEMLQKTYGDRVIDRMNEMFEVLIFKSKSYRR